MRFRCGHLSITGNFRDNNEDSLYVDPECRYFLVADGMGGQSAGEKASSMAAELFSRTLEQRIDFQDDVAADRHDEIVKCIDEAVAYANSEIIALGQVDPEMHQMGTTLVFAVRVADQLFIGGVGDSRCYHHTGGVTSQLTTDHSLTQALVDAGTITREDAATHRYKNVLYRYLGTKDGSKGTQASPVEPAPGDRFMLCSDGVTDGIEIENIQQILEDHAHPQDAAEKLVSAAEAGGSRDNITCVVIDVEAD
ncbi:PP2C family protein-serine/threonine phosphatase [Stratiformator vulcanicus]|uniref:Serine/threonine phosphatase stp n=1 Tax=Stratiformator vulcanicus TaxID=2527980 RepID=A0A517R3I6_9PLAN|nr:protein phosphatase 2C domain-containing protein [Stratiformator vulcanicus]QDT38459.1 Serine/threonine phosphatase stp [Stratiformator vulcanicus]